MSSETSTNVFRVATFNVHNWEDGEFADNVRRVVELVKSHDPDVLCLQETQRTEQEQFDILSGYEKIHMFAGCSIVCKKGGKHGFKFAYNGKSSTKRVRFVTVEMHLNGDETEKVFLTTMHLNYIQEPRRLTEIERVREVLEPLFLAEERQIWTGDFNALTEEDYTPDVWREITEVRARNNWELPKTELTSKVRGYGFTDTWASLGRPPPIKTCRFDTHIDYVYATPSFTDSHALMSVKHVEDSASDHNMVVAEFKL